MERLSPAQIHLRKASAALAHSNEQVLLENLDEYEKMLYLLARHKKDLKAIASMEQRASYKKSILHHYLPWIEGALSAGNGKQDNVLMTWQVWSVDCGEYHLALQIADYAIHQDLTLPDGFSRSLCAMLAEEFADAAKKAQKVQKPFEVSYLLRVDELTKEKDMPDESRARLYREIGLLLETTRPEKALSYLERALELNLNIGVQGSIKKLRKQLNQADTD
ncbi:phage terminase small subunit [Glaesserella parasuis]|uniref:Phage terminase small subunit n=2 Tax=Glaesserella parasuis TaxID=738 RepID=A0AAJ6AEQ7_GLAPU|nr:phage terminase small subunit [Glaesserella parasuis]MDG6360602.1 phage terminase small subunit [Glaesserella parasuis]MDO9813680.1 phage terminase small subunit [Glaesserella parasuis]WGE11178.1 phage terminase small subunit [Glaesserella parasuis]